MAKSIVPANSTDENYVVDLVSDSGHMPTGNVQTHLRNLLVACELGDLVLLECERTSDGALAYVICASVVSSDNRRRLLPICELEDTAELLTRFRPPTVAEDGFVKPTHTGRYEVCVINNPDEVALTEVDVDSNVH